MKNIIVFVLLACASLSIFSKDVYVWDYSFYEEVEYTNFREYNIFYQELIASTPDIPLLNAALFFITNEERQKRNLEILSYDYKLEIAAYNHSKQMVVNDFFSHENEKVSERKTPEKRGNLAGISNPKIAENIAYNYIMPGDTYISAAEKIMEIWMNSRSHRNNILSRQALQLGCGVFIKNEDVIFATQKFQWFIETIEAEASDLLPAVKKGRKELIIE